LFWYKPLFTLPYAHVFKLTHCQGRRRQRTHAGKPGARLITERYSEWHTEPGLRLRTKELQVRYGLGLSPLRESLQRLSAEGMVVNDAQRGFAVAAVTVAELHDLTVARTALESTMLPMAINLGSADWEGDIVAAFHRLSRTPLPNDPAAIADASLWELRHRSFHHALVAGCGSPWLLRLHGQLVDQSERYRKIRILHHQESQAQVRDVNAEHQAVMEAVLRRDAEQAVVLMTKHLVATSDAIARLMAPP
jgi:GntR family transcriptional regulator, carbon starvation induced regulator